MPLRSSVADIVCAGPAFASGAASAGAPRNRPAIIMTPNETASPCRFMALRPFPPGTRPGHLRPNACIPETNRGNPEIRDLLDGLPAARTWTIRDLALLASAIRLAREPHG